MLQDKVKNFFLFFDHQKIQSQKKKWDKYELDGKTPHVSRKQTEQTPEVPSSSDTSKLDGGQLIATSAESIDDLATKVEKLSTMIAKRKL